MKQEVKIGQTDYTVLILIRDTAGAPKTGLTNASAGIDVCYTRVETDNDVVTTAGAIVALATPALTDVHLDWGFLQVDATNAPGLYRLDIADGVFATGAWSAVVSLIATGIDPVHIEFILVPESPYTGVNTSMWNGTVVHAPATAGVPYVDVHNWLGAAAPAMTGDPFTDSSGVTELLTRIPDATAGANGGLTICGSNAATTFASLTVTGATILTGNVAIADGVSIAAPSTGNRPGIVVAGNGTGAGISITGGGTNANGVTIVGGASNGIGVYVQGDGTGSGIRADGGETGHGLMLLGGSTSGHGINAAGSTQGSGLYLVGAGAGAGVHAYGGLTGNGVEAAGGGTSGDGIYAKAAGTGNGLACHGGGIAGDGIYAIADNDGDGITATGLLAGAGIIATGGVTGPGLLASGGGNNANADGIRAVAGGALATDIDASLQDDVTTLLTRLSDTRAIYLDYLFSIYFGLVSGVNQAQGGGAATVTLAAGASAVNDFYKGQTISIYTGTGAGQARAIYSYVGATKVATITPAWATPPDNTSWYVIMNVGSAIVEDWIDGGRLDLILDAILADTNELQVDDYPTSIAAVKVDTAAIKVRTDLLPSGIKKNTALTNFEFYMVLAADHISPALLKVVDCQRSIDGAAFANCNTAVATEVSAGVYKLNLAASDLNGDVITFKFSEATCDTRMITIKTST